MKKMSFLLKACSIVLLRACLSSVDDDLGSTPNAGSASDTASKPPSLKVETVAPQTKNSTHGTEAVLNGIKKKYQFSLDESDVLEKMVYTMGSYRLNDCSAKKKSAENRKTCNAYRTEHNRLAEEADAIRKNHNIDKHLFPSILNAFYCTIHTDCADDTALPPGITLEQLDQ